MHGFLNSWLAYNFSYENSHMQIQLLLLIFASRSLTLLCIVLETFEPLWFKVAK